MTLLEKLKAATEGSRELDAAIAGLHWNSVALYWHQNGKDHTGPHYTTSIDAALTLVPEGFDYVAGSLDEDGGFAEIGPKGTFAWDEAKASTPALAICIAAIAARENEHERD